MTFEELLQQNPALRNLRSLDADTLRSLFRRARGECTWCGQQVGKGRRTWCSKECTEGFFHRCSPSHQQIFVTRRDKEICQLCGRDLAKSKRIFEHVKRFMKQAGLITPMMAWRESDLALLDIQEALGFSRGRWYEIDHKTPVCEGGGLCDPSGLRLLCGKCHKKETDDLAARRAAKTQTKTKKKATTR